MSIYAVISVILLGYSAAPDAQAVQAPASKPEQNTAPIATDAKPHSEWPDSTASTATSGSKQKTSLIDETNYQSKLQSARHVFAYGDYAKAIILLEDLVLPGRLNKKQDLIDAQRMLGISAAMTGQEHEARRAFMDLLFLNPDVKLDPFLTPPRAVEFFESVASEMQNKLKELRAQKNKGKTSKPVLKTETIVERRLQVRSPWIVLVPFGYPQFSRKSWGLGTLMLSLQSMSLGVHVATAIVDANLLTSDGYMQNRDMPLHQGLRLANWIAAGSGLLVYAIGVGEAWMSYQKETLISERRLQIPVEELRKKSAPKPKAKTETKPTNSPAKNPAVPGPDLQTDPQAQPPTSSASPDAQSSLRSTRLQYTPIQES